MLPRRADPSTEVFTFRWPSVLDQDAADAVLARSLRWAGVVLRGSRTVRKLSSRGGLRGNAPGSGDLSGDEERRCCARLDLKAPAHRSPGVPKSRRAEVPGAPQPPAQPETLMHRSSGAPKFRRTEVPAHRSHDGCRNRRLEYRVGLRGPLRGCSSLPDPPPGPSRLAARACSTRALPGERRCRGSLRASSPRRHVEEALHFRFRG